MIIAKLIGGLGNQMFQYAAGRMLAKTHNTELMLDITGYINQVGITPREFKLDIFNIQTNIANQIDIDRLKNSKFLHKFLNKNSYIKEKHFHFDQNILTLPNNIYLEGYWTSEKYFKNIEQIIRQEFTYTNKPDKVNQELMKQISACNSISIHVRRGDYVENERTNQFHGVCGLDYYKTAISYVAQGINNPHFFVFSDDPRWCKKNLHLKYPTTYFTNNLGKKDYEDMRLMSQCQHNIIANSSFSWWGAWLNQNPSKIVIAPKQWFHDTSIDTKDICPESWISI